MVSQANELYEFIPTPCPNYLMLICWHKSEQFLANANAQLFAPRGLLATVTTHTALYEEESHTLLNAPLIFCESRLEDFKDQWKVATKSSDLMDNYKAPEEQVKSDYTHVETGIEEQNGNIWKGMAVEKVGQTAR